MTEASQLTKDASIILSDVIAHFKTVASIGNHHLLVEEYDRLILTHSQRESKTETCLGFIRGISEFLKNTAFGVVYMVQALLIYYWEDYEMNEPKRMFAAMFALMFGVFTFA